MLVEIEKMPTAENSAIHLHPTDNVAVARVPIAAGTELRVDGMAVVARDAIPAGHKIALWDIGEGEVVERYGQAIGRAKSAIETGSWIHTHNLAFEELKLEYEFPAGEKNAPGARADQETRATFLGYKREDGRVGTRNYIAVVAASNCAAHTAELIARSYEGERMPPNVDGVVAFPHGEGCAHSPGPDLQQLQRTLGGVLMHPNVSAAVILGLGCETNQIEHYLGAGGPRSTRLAGMTLQGRGGAGGARGGGPGGAGRDARGGAARDRAVSGAGVEGGADAAAGIEDRARVELRRIGLVQRDHGESGAGLLFGSAGGDRRIAGAGGDDGDFRRRASAGEARAQSRGRGEAAGMHPSIQGVPGRVQGEQL